MDFSIKTGDTLPVLKARLKDVSGAPLNLSSVTSVQMRVRQILAGSSPVQWAKACVITGPLLGLVEFHWGPGDTATVGTYEAEFVLLWSNGATQTIPNGPNPRIEILPTLG